MKFSSTAAYQADMNGRQEEFGANDAAWITVASILEHARRLSAADQARLVRAAADHARSVIGPERLDYVAEREWQDRDRTPAESVLVLADDAEQAGAFNMAIALLDGLDAAHPSLNEVQRGRLIAKRARVASKQGEIEDAADRYRQVERLGRQCGSAELRVRAWIGMGALAQMRGNYPEVVRQARRAARLADRAQLRALERRAHYGLMIAAGVARRLDEALHHGWIVYQRSLGSAIDEAEALLNFGQVFLDAGYADAARAAFASILTRKLPARILLPALGGLALAAAGSEHRAIVFWATAETKRLGRTAVPRYALASALLECALALSRIGREADAERCRRAALRMAKRYGFHEVRYRADAMADRAGPTAMTEVGKTTPIVAREILSMEPKRLPKNVAVSAVTIVAE